MSSEVNNPNQSLPYHIRGAFRGFETALSRYLATNSFPLSQFHILRLQWKDTGHSQKDIAKESFMTESVASQVIKVMEKDGLLERKSDQADSRKKRVFLTSKGKSLREELVTEGMKIAKTHSPDVSSQDLQTAIDVLIKVRQAFDRYNEAYNNENRLSH